MSKFSKKVWAASLFGYRGFILKPHTRSILLAASCLGTLVTAPVHAKDSDAWNVKKAPDVTVAPHTKRPSNDYHFQKMKYDVYAGGIHAVKADMALDFRTKGRYNLTFSAETRGILGSLAPWKGTFSSEGWALPKGVRRPQEHQSIAEWQGEKEIKTYHYAKDGAFKELTTLYNHKKPKSRIPDPALTKGTTDALTATIKILEHVSDGGKCEGSSEVFDGKRRYKLIYKHQRFVKLEKTRYNTYSGPAAECTVEVKPISGAWYKKPRGWLSIQEQGRERGTMPTVWIAQVTENAVAVPVRVRVKTAYGTLFMHMTRYESGDTVLSVK